MPRSTGPGRGGTWGEPARSGDSIMFRSDHPGRAGPVSFHDCADTMLLLGGGSDQAGFVQIIQGRVPDRERIHTLAQRSTGLLSRHRPDVLGATIAIDDDGVFSETIAFTSEAAARAAERQEMPPEARQLVDEEMSLLDEVTFLDLHQPWFASHG